MWHLRGLLSVQLAIITDSESVLANVVVQLLLKLRLNIEIKWVGLQGPVCGICTCQETFCSTFTRYCVHTC